MRLVNIYAYEVNGQKVGIDMSTLDREELHGNPPFIAVFSGNTVPSGYTEISSVENWDTYGFGIANDYGVARFAIKELVNEIGWTGLTHTEKDIAIKHHSAPTTTDAVMYMIFEHGMSQAEATQYVIKQWHQYYIQFIGSCKQRWEYVMLLIPQFLSFEDAEDLFDTIDSLIGYYNNAARLGRNYGNANDGILDYVESTNGFVGQGLVETNYTLIQGDWSTLINYIIDILHNGIYEKNENL